MIRVLVTGCHGLLGQKLVEILTPDFCELHGLDVHTDNLFASRQRYGDPRRSQNQTNWMCFVGRDAFSSEIACDETDRDGQAIVAVIALQDHGAAYSDPP